MSVCKSVFSIILMSLVSVVANAELIRVRLFQVKLPMHVRASESLQVNGKLLRGESIRSSGTTLVETRLESIPHGGMAVAGRNLQIVGSNRPNDAASEVHSLGEIGRVVIYPGTLRKSAMVVASLDLDEYLRGVLPSEMPIGWPKEALKAQAIASRSFLMAKVSERQASRFHIDSTVMDQVYKSRSRLSALDQGKLREILDETSGEVLVGHRNEVIAAYFHADCGGQTESAQDVWGGKLVSAGTTQDAFCPLNPEAKWSYRLTSEELSSRLAKNIGLKAGDDVVSITPGENTSSGRMKVLRLVTAQGQELEISGQDFRQVIGFDKIKSTLFSIRKVEDKHFMFIGRGYGHGVGLCQWGAKMLASRGHDYKAILKHYYPRAGLEVYSQRRLRLALQSMDAGQVNTNRVLRVEMKSSVRLNRSQPVIGHVLTADQSLDTAAPAKTSVLRQ